jgi:hypothetical protein
MEHEMASTTVMDNVSGSDLTAQNKAFGAYLRIYAKEKVSISGFGKAGRDHVGILWIFEQGRQIILKNH